MKKTFHYRFWEMIARIIFPKRKVVYKVLPKEGEVAVFVSNHSGAVGPSNMILYFDRPIKPWIIDCVLNKEVNQNFIYHDFFFARASKHKRIMRFFSWIVSIILPPLLKAQDPIEVHRTSPRIIETFKNSVNALKEGNNLVIFSESPEKYGKYINKLYNGFAKLGKFYYDDTGKILRFFPVYVGNGLKTINVGEPIAYDPKAESKKMSTIISDHIEKEIEALGAEQPKHNPISFVPDKYYKYYSEFLGKPMDYWRFCEQKRSE